MTYSILILSFLANAQFTPKERKDIWFGASWVDRQFSNYLVVPEVQRSIRKKLFSKHYNIAQFPVTKKLQNFCETSCKDADFSQEEFLAPFFDEKVFQSTYRKWQTLGAGVGFKVPKKEVESMMGTYCQSASSKRCKSVKRQLCLARRTAACGTIMAMGSLAKSGEAYSEAGLVNGTNFCGSPANFHKISNPKKKSTDKMVKYKIPDGEEGIYLSHLLKPMNKPDLFCKNHDKCEMLFDIQENDPKRWDDLLRKSTPSKKIDKAGLTKCTCHQLAQCEMFQFAFNNSRSRYKEVAKQAEFSHLLANLLNSTILDIDRALTLGKTATCDLRGHASKDGQIHTLNYDLTDRQNKVKIDQHCKRIQFREKKRVIDSLISVVLREREKMVSRAVH